MKWEYCTCPIDNDDQLKMEKSFNMYGSEKWELVSVDNGIAYFKRPVKKTIFDNLNIAPKRYGYDSVQDGYVIYDNHTAVKLSGLEVETLLNND